jgi:hypothetical protein
MPAGVFPEDQLERLRTFPGGRRRLAGTGRTGSVPARPAWMRTRPAGLPAWHVRGLLLQVPTLATSSTGLIPLDCAIGGGAARSSAVAVPLR